ncbi:branched-chain amino acid ABC transporter permease [Kerstersia gyiorum]|uniref:branched-chain amino acid ABC transporter permease n=1 Tax=Kerstersia gyiorum TaxID=206506 RepID=UPI0020A029A3|nr:branched-chain amino acid ABC transporter permease [Kerstersia gyiorum]MCP1677610.1 branched-chain amino acid transport system permease protein [Kerstersia gyiorum]MCP1822499.1 branched-chain amino acid transport system permease protein [Kerstersia gyiorum]MCP1825923.1 branched-chain amino acid transport system permease protein [Kerstersia gyiorum]MCW2449799.1 branched-chain amino acid transport system permease protein [Kerstersia gyiorum]
MDSSTLQIILSGLGTGSIYALIAVGFNIIFKSTGALNFAQGEWVMMGGLLAAFCFNDAQMPVWQACLLAGLAVAVIGGLTERLLIRPLLNQTPFAITLVTVGIALLSKSLVMLSLGKNPVGYPGLSQTAFVPLWGASVATQTLWILGITLVFMILAQLFFNHTRWGCAMRAAAANPAAAALVGIRHHRVVLGSFIIAAAAVGGLAGTIITPLTLMSYDSGAMLGFKGFSAAMLGGLGSLFGATLGGLLLGLLEALVSGFITSQFKDAAAFLVLLLVLVLRPQGLLGKAEVTKL